jgi:hypothetical protein
MHRLKIYLPARIAGSRLHGASTIGKLVLLGGIYGSSCTVWFQSGGAHKDFNPYNELLWSWNMEV